MQDAYSDVKTVGAGVPQGAVLSPTLFNIMLSDLPEDPRILTYTYADDLTFSMTGNDLTVLRSVLQGHLNVLINWLNSWGMEVSPAKSSFQVFSRSRKLNTNFKINNSTLPQVKTQKILGITFDGLSLLISLQGICDTPVPPA